MAGRMHCVSCHGPDLVALAVAEQPVELRTIALELGAFVEDLAEGVLYDGDILTDPEFSSKLILDKGSCRQMIGMNVGLDDPLELEPAVPDMRNDPVGALVGDAAGRIVDIHHGVHDSARGRRGILHDIGNRIRLVVEKPGYFRLDRKVGHEGNVLAHLCSPGRSSGPNCRRQTGPDHPRNDNPGDNRCKENG